MSESQLKDEKARLRELARKTLEAYRKLNSAAADASFARERQLNREPLKSASELLEGVVAEIKGP